MKRKIALFFVAVLYVTSQRIQWRLGRMYRWLLTRYCTTQDMLVMVRMMMSRAGVSTQAVTEAVTNAVTEGTTATIYTNQPVIVSAPDENNN